MEESLDLEKKANLYAGRKLEALRGEESRVVFGKRIGILESQLYKLERGRVRLTVGKMTHIANLLDVPLSYFLLPDDDPALDKNEINKIDKKEETAA